MIGLFNGLLICGMATHTISTQTISDPQCIIHQPSTINFLIHYLDKPSLVIQQLDHIYIYKQRNRKFKHDQVIQF